MADEEPIQRVTPVSGNDLDRRSVEEHAVAPEQMGVAEVHSSKDHLGFTRFFVGHKHVGGYLYHGPVADEAAMRSLDNPGIAHACYPGDTCLRTDTGAVMLCVSNFGGLAADWVPIAGSGLTPAELTTALAALALTDSGAGASLIAAAPCTVRKLRAGANITLTADATGVEIAFSGVSGSVIIAPDGPPGTELELAYTSAGDTGGLIYYIGTNGGKTAFANPAQLSAWSSGKIAALRSSNGTGTAIDLTDRTLNANSHTNNPGVGEWAAWDFGPINLLAPTHYTLRNRGSYSDLNVLRNWKLQGTNEVSAWTVGGINAATWTDLDTRTADTTIAATTGAWGAFTLASPPTTPYRYLRIVTTGVDSSGDYYLTITEAEFYGAALLLPSLPDRMTGWLTDGAGHFWPYV